jgi:hypothetical protein
MPAPAFAGWYSGNEKGGEDFDLFTPLFLNPKL